MSLAVGSSFEPFFWATSMMLLPASMAASSALMERWRPTKSGITMWGKTTTSRRGNSGRVWLGIWLSFIGFPKSVLTAVPGTVQGDRGQHTRHLGMIPKDYKNTRRLLRVSL